eukprot:GHVT01076262.1.p1 GENE.GHVT01076262.1~~GHVT01076262.1.p1  ORF type:complete len:136 (+),score=39.82 GHVT01076262.1:109-516(+)
MLNFIPKRTPAVSLLFGKRLLQRIEVGAARHQVEIPIDILDKIHAAKDTSVAYHNGDFHPLKWKEFVKLKLDACHLLQAAEAGDGATSKSSLSGLNWFPQLTSLYTGHQALKAVDVALAASTPPKLAFPIVGVNC